MSMTRTLSETSTFTKTSARHVASKVAADLRLVQLAYGDPDDERIAAYEAELVELLAGGYVRRVTYGFRRYGSWISPTLRYEALLDGTLIVDDRAGKIPRGCDVDGARFGSYLCHNSKWDRLSSAEKSAIERELPFQRSAGEEPGTLSGTWVTDKSYSHNGGGLSRSALRSNL